MQSNSSSTPALAFKMGWEVTIATAKNGWHPAEVDILARTIVVFRDENNLSNVLVLMGHWDLESLEKRLGEEKDGVSFGYLSGVQSRRDERLPIDLIGEFEVKSLQENFVFA